MTCGSHRVIVLSQAVPVIKQLKPSSKTIFNHTVVLQVKPEMNILSTHLKYETFSLCL